MTSANVRYGFALFITATLVACGGGGGGDGGGGNGGGGNPPPSRTAQTLAYSAGDGVSANGTTEMYSISDDGSGRVMLSNDLTLDTTTIKDFAVSPNGQWVAYISNVSNFVESGLYVNSVNGGTPVRISRTKSSFGGAVSSFHWSPDSTQLVYAGNLGGGGLSNASANEIFLVNRDGSGDTKINGSIGNPAVVEGRNPQWSPDGRYILQEVATYNSNNGGSANPFALNVYDTTVGSANSRRLVTSNDTLRNARWSPTSTRVSYMSDELAQSIYHVYAIDVFGSPRTRVTDFADFNSDSRWSPDGSTLAYLDNPTSPFPSDLITSAATGGATDTVLVFVSPTGKRVYDYAWSPDGSQIAYTSDQETQNQRELYVINANGSGSGNKISGSLISSADVFDFAWSPNGNSVAYLADQDTDTFIDLYVSSVSGNSNDWISMGLSGEEVTSFAWSDDSQRLAFSTGPEGRRPQANKLYVSQPNGSGRAEISAAMTIGPLNFAYD